MNEYVQSKVGPPGIALAVFGILSLLINLIYALFQLIGAMTNILMMVDSGAGGDVWVAWFMSTGFYIVMQLLSALWSVLIIFGGLRLRSARSPALVYVASFLAAFPCCSGYCCCWFGLPLAIWAVVSMQDDQVKAAFAEG